MSQDVALLVQLAALDQAPIPEDLPDRRTQGLGAVDDEQPSALRVKAALDEVSKQRLRDAAVLRIAFPKAQNLLLPLTVDA